MSYLPGAGLPIDVAYTLSAVVVGVLMLAPGFGLALGLGRRAGWDLAEVVGASFAFGLAVVGAVTLVAHYARLTLTAAMIGCAVLFVAGWVAGAVLGRGQRVISLGPEGLLFGFIAAAVAVVERPWFANAADTFYHLASVRSLLVMDRPVVTDPFYGTKLDVLDPTTGVWQSALAMLSKVTGLDVMRLWPGATAVGAAMTLLAFWVLCRRVGASRPGAAIGTTVFFALGLMADMRWFAYPNRMSLALVFLALAGFAALLDRPSAGDTALAVTAGFAAISLHLAAAAVIVLMALFIGILLLLASVAAKLMARGWEWKPVASLALTGIALAVVSAAVLVPKAGVIAGSALVGQSAQHIARQTQPVVGGMIVAGPTITGAGRALVAFGTVLGLLAAVPAYFEGDRKALACVGIALFPAAIFFNPLLATPLFDRSQYLAWRIAILLPFAFYVAIAWGLSRMRKADWAGQGMALVAVMAIVAAAWTGGPPLAKRFLAEKNYDVLGFPISHSRDIRLMWGPEVLAYISSEVGDSYPVVAGDLDTTYQLSGVMPIAVLAAPPKHAPFAVEAIDGPQRRKEVETLMDPATPEAGRRAILERRGVGYVVVSSAGKSFSDTIAEFRKERDLLEPVVESKTLVLFRVKRQP